MKNLIGRIMQGLGWLMFLASWVLYHLSGEKMGVQRDYIFRNKKLMAQVFEGKISYGLIAFMVLSLVFILSTWRNNKKSSGTVIMIPLLGLACLLVLLFKSSIVFVGLPMVLLSMVCIYLGKLINYL